MVNGKENEEMLLLQVRVESDIGSDIFLLLFLLVAQTVLAHLLSQGILLLSRLQVTTTANFLKLKYIGKEGLDFVVVLKAQNP